MAMNKLVRMILSSRLDSTGGGNVWLLPWDKYNTYRIQGVTGPEFYALMQCLKSSIGTFHHQNN